MFFPLSTNSLTLDQSQIVVLLNNRVKWLLFVYRDICSFFQAPKCPLVWYPCQMVLATDLHTLVSTLPFMLCNVSTLPCMQWSHNLTCGSIEFKSFEFNEFLLCDEQMGQYIQYFVLYFWMAQA